MLEPRFINRRIVKNRAIMMRMITITVDSIGQYLA